jgi:Transposase
LRAYGIPLKALGNWRAKFTAEPQPPALKLLYRRGDLSHTLSRWLSPPGPIVPPPRDGHRRAFSEEDKRRIVEETMRPGASLSEVARRCGIAARLLFRWKQELTVAAPVFVSVEIADGVPPAGEQVL